MKNNTKFSLILTALMIVLVAGCKTRPGNNSESAGIEVPQGFEATVVAESLGEGRHVVVNSNGDIYVSLRNQKNGGGVAGIRDTNRDGKADVIEYFGKFTGTGLAIYNGYLYVGADTIVVRYKLKEGELIPDMNHEVIAYGFVPENQHETKSLAFDNSGNMYVTVGAPSNACQNPDRTPGTKGMDPCPLLERYGGIWRFDAGKTNQHQMKDGYRFATGIRNAVAVDWNHHVNKLYALQHGRDQLSQFWPGLFSEDQSVDLPAEEFFLVNDGDDFGWPYCYYDQNISKKLLAPEYGGDGRSEGRCKDKSQPIMAFPAHIAPNDLIFHSGKSFPDKYKNGAFIAFHGSWNRAPKEQKGFFVAFVPFDGEKPLGDWEIFADKFAGKKVIMSPGEAEHRPCGVAEGPDGALYIVDSVKGRLWKIVYKS